MWNAPPDAARPKAAEPQRQIKKLFSDIAMGDFREKHTHIQPRPPPSLTRPQGPGPPKASQNV